MSSTPRATPVVPFASPDTGAAQPPVPSQLKAPVVVVAAGREWEHEAGDLVIGRDAMANIVLPDPLVSRRHARLHVDDEGRVSIEDLNSANGVFVNGRKISRPSLVLGEGDRVLIGTTEISLFSLRASAQVRLGRMVPKTSPEPVPAPQNRGIPAYAQQRSEPPIPAPPKRTAATTSRADAINMVGQFAEKLMATGHALEAVRSLSDHLQNLLKGASAGLSVPERILESATRYALRLHAWTNGIAWLDYVLELHLAAHQVPSHASIDDIRGALGARMKFDASLVRYFITTIETRPEPLSDDERHRIGRIAELCASK